jgi:hypothetical protein
MLKMNKLRSSHYVFLWVYAFKMYICSRITLSWDLGKRELDNLGVGLFFVSVVMISKSKI